MALLTCDTSEMIEQLAVCVAWCGDRLPSVDETADIGMVFRSTQLSSQAARAFPNSCHTEYSDGFLDAFRDFQSERSKLIAEPSPSIASLLNRPRSLLVFDWRYSLFDGAATPESLGYFDDDFMPPWDVWLTLINTTGKTTDECYLLSWVPESLGEYVNRGIIVDPAESLFWCSLKPDGRLELIGWGHTWAL